MENKKLGRLLFSIGIFMWVAAAMLKVGMDVFLYDFLMYGGVLIEIAGFIIVQRNGGFRKR